MNYEKAYKEALERAKSYHDDPNCFKHMEGCLEHIFPELKESEDERIRKELLNAFQESEDSLYMVLTPHRRESFIAWLEKQGKTSPILSNSLNIGKVEQKPTDKVEPKFNIGDWVMLDRPVLITKIEDMPYNTHQYWTSDGTWFGDATEAKLWTIQDAKDGDVLCCESGWTCLFKALDNHTNTFSSYCFMDSDKWFCDTGSEGHTLNKEFMKAYNGKIKPATKGQRDTFFTKMKEAGYEWDAEKKELKKVEQKSSWSEEDETGLTNTIIMLKEGASLHFNKKDITKAVDWLKSLKERYIWKPSEEQLKSLEQAARYYNCGKIKLVGTHLNEIIEQLKAL